MTIFDRIIGYISPSSALRREVARRQLSALRSIYDAGNVSDIRRARSVVAPTGPQQESDLSRTEIIAQARDLDRNNSWAHGVFNSIANNVVGPGMVPEARVMTATGEQNERLNSRIEDIWKRWADGVDITGRRSIYDLQWLAEREQWITGEILAIRTEAPRSEQSGKVPLRLDIVEAERLWEMTKEEKNGTRIIQGVEYDANSRIAAYWIYPDNPSDWIRPRIDPVRVPSDRVVHLFHERRPNQVRGISPITSSLKTFQALNQYFDFELTRARISSAFVGAITKQGTITFPGTGNTADTLDDDLNDIGYIEGGMIGRLKPGEDIKFGSPSVTSTAFEPFVVTMLRSLAVGLNVSYELLARDFTKTNFSSARQSSLEDWKHWSPRQEKINRVFNGPIWRWFIDSAIAASQLSIPNPDRVGAFWKSTGRQWVDPQKEVAADIAAIRSGLDSPQSVAARRGKDYATIIQDLEQARKMAERAGVSLDIFTSSPAPAQEKKPPKNEEEPEEEEVEENESEESDE